MRCYGVENINKHKMSEIEVLNSAIKRGIITSDEAYEALDLYQEECLEGSEQNALQAMIVGICDTSDADPDRVQQWQQQHGEF